MYYFETISSILSVFQDMLKFIFKLFAIYFNILNCGKMEPLQVH